MKKILRSRVALLTLLVPCLGLGPIGCGPEMVPMILVVTGTVGAVALTIHQLQAIHSADLDIKMKTLQLRGMQDGQLTTVRQPLSDAQFREVADSGRVTVNGVVVPVSRPE